MNAKQNNKANTLVLGGKGKTGSRVVAQLQQLEWPVYIGSRSGDRPFDWEDQATWKEAIRDMEVIYLSYYPDIAVPGAVDVIRAFTQLAVECGVKQLVLLSGRGEAEAQACEKMVMALTIDWTIVRASWFCQNFSEGYLLDPVLAGQVALPVGDIPEPFVDADDIAAVAVTAITQPGHNHKVYEVTGPRLLTFKEAVGTIARETGRDIVFEQMPLEDYKAMLKEYAIPDDFIWLITYLFKEVLDGRNASIAHGVQEALGRPATDFNEYAKRTAKTGLWG
ncbi:MULTISPECIES: NmrA family NAD(P)-binding protein [Niastella]|uniref:NmrA family transcriptional regulator n=1 Tax=Niastella soli TaxID=2821487 RepID=A0ABS3YZN4_9BACT|nr:NmrA family transcriptional regulator [Niastella soli]MBO9203289.1 NmrA family transcriptional regulator [Niastella soli]